MLKHLCLVLVSLSLAVAATACNSSPLCETDSCVCPSDTSCDHACEEGGPPCHVQCAPGQACDVQCAPSEECHVEATQSSTLTVDCAGTQQGCHVTCPAAGCTVTNCIGDCVVTCGLFGVATHNGSTAVCP